MIKAKCVTCLGVINFNISNILNNQMLSCFVEEPFEKAIDKKSSLKYYVKMELIEQPSASVMSSR